MSEVGSRKRLNGGQRSLDGREPGPPLGEFTVEFSGLGEDVQDAVDSLAQVIRFKERQRAGLQQYAAIVGRISHVPLGVDSRPRLPAGTQGLETTMQVWANRARQPASSELVNPVRGVCGVRCVRAARLRRTRPGPHI